MNKLLKNKYKKCFGWPKPYSWMVKDLIGGMYYEKGRPQGSYLVALGLICYTEIIGREILSFNNPNVKKESLNKKKCFNTFLGSYMSYNKILEDFPDIYESFRHGLCHQYSIRGPETGVFVFYEPSSINDFKKMGVDTTKGLLLHKQNIKKVFVIEPYLENFINGIEKFLKEKKEI